MQAFVLHAEEFEGAKNFVLGDFCPKLFTASC